MRSFLVADKTTEDYSPMIIAIIGPTATGKSRLTLEMAGEIDGEIISVDSTLVYRGMDIGTDKPSLEDQRKIPHHLIDIVSPHEHYSVASFISDCQSAIKVVHARRKPAILCGGSMLYFHSLFNGLSKLPRANLAYRETLKVQWSVDAQSVHDQLQSVDPESAKRIHPNDQQRIIRALEVHHIGDATLSSQQKSQAMTPTVRPNVSVMMTVHDRATLHQMIERRFHRMLDAGFIKEVEALLSNNLIDADSSVMRTVGYRQMSQYIQGKMAKAEAIESAISSTRQLAKRQLTWMQSIAKKIHTNHIDFQDERRYDKVLSLIAASV